MAVCRVIKDENYTVMSNHHLKDINLSLKAIGLLSKILSLTDDWGYTIKGLCTICKENETAVNSALKELKEHGYLIVEKIKPCKENKGRWTYVYSFYEFPQEITESTQKPKNDKTKKASKKQDPEIQDLENLPLETLPLETQDLENIPLYKSTNKSSTNISSTNLSNPNQSKSVEMIDLIGSDEYEEIYQTVSLNIQYDHFEAILNSSDLERVNEIVEIIVETLANTSNKINISGQDYLATTVKNRLLKLEAEHIEYVLECLDSNTTEIKNVKRYLLATLFNAPTTINNYYTSKVNHDLYG